MKASTRVLALFVGCFLLGSTPAESQSVEDLQRQIDSLKRNVQNLQQKVWADRRTSFRQEQKFVELDPGEIAHADILCPIGKVAVGGGFGSEPAEPLLVKASTFFFDAVAERSGWTVTFVNVTDAIYQGHISVSGSCAGGVGVP